MISWIIGLIAAASALLLLYVSTRPNTFRIQRSLMIKAPAETIFHFLNDFHEWENWSPWEKVDPAIKRTYRGAAQGGGALYEWQGNKQIGQGRMEIIESSPPARLVIKIDFISPIAAHNTIEFILDVQGDATLVTQAMYGPSPFLSRLMSLIFNMDKMVGQKFEEGLASLKALAEGAAG